MSVGVALLLAVGGLLVVSAVVDLAARRKGRRIRIDSGELRDRRRAARTAMRQARLGAAPRPKPRDHDR